MIRKNIKQRIKEYFLQNPTARLRVRGIERATGLPLPSVIRYTKELEKEGILKTITTGGVVFYGADRTNKHFLLEKRLFNIRQIYEAGLVDYLKQELSNPPIVLFGSYANGEDTEDSDVDLYIETPSQKRINLEMFETKLQRRIQVFRHKTIREIRNVHLANNIVNGITLNNYLEVFK